MAHGWVESADVLMRKEKSVFRPAVTGAHVQTSQIE